MRAFFCWGCLCVKVFLRGTPVCSQTGLTKSTSGRILLVEEQILHTPYDCAATRVEVVVYPVEGSLKSNNFSYILSSIASSLFG